jgi:hypothetical protein
VNILVLVGVPAMRRRAIRFNLFERLKKDFRYYPSRKAGFYRTPYRRRNKAETHAIEEHSGESFTIVGSRVRGALSYRVLGTL